MKFVNLMNKKNPIFVDRSYAEQRISHSAANFAPMCKNWCHFCVPPISIMLGGVYILYTQISHFHGLSNEELVRSHLVCEDMV